MNLGYQNMPQNRIINDSLAEFGQHSDPKTQHLTDAIIANRLADVGNVRSVQVAGDLCWDIGIRDYLDPEQQELWTSAAKQLWQDSSEVSETFTDSNIFAFRSLLNLAFFDVRKSIDLDKEQPSKEVVKTSHQALQGIGKLLLSHLITAQQTVDLYKDANNRLIYRHADSLAGVFSTAWLLQRFCDQELGDGSMTVLPSLAPKMRIKCFYGNVKHSDYNLAVNSQKYPKGTNLYRKIQVRAGGGYKDRIFQEEYDDDILPISFRRDLAVESEEKKRRLVSVERVLRELINESSSPNPSTGLVKILDQRTILIIDRLDQAA